MIFNFKISKFALLAMILSLGSIATAEPSKSEKNTSEQTESKSKDSDSLPIEQLRTFAEVYNLIKSTYVDEVDDETLIKGAISGMLDSLDPHSTYLNEESYKDIQESSAGQYGGLGIEVIPDGHGIKIITPIDDSPAKRAGILAGDQVVKINNTPLRNIKADDAMELMRGELGENVLLNIRRKGQTELLEFNLVRELIQLKSIRSQWLGNGMAYVRITQFQRRTGYDLVDAIERLREEHDGKIRGLVLDLRNNPGGVLTAAQSVSDAFLEDGLIISTKGRAILAKYAYKAQKGDILYGAPIVILINGGSASAAEIVAGALQDNNRAIIMGTRSFGKGSVQTLMPVTSETALKLTTARYYTPSGRSIQGSGIKPDIRVVQRELSEIFNDENTDDEIHESDLDGALVAEQLAKNIDDESTRNTESDDVDIRSVLASDFQLSEAVNLLRGISILSMKSN